MPRSPVEPDCSILKDHTCPITRSPMPGVLLSRSFGELATRSDAGIEIGGRLLVRSPRRYARSQD
jgi:hypothetical protein